LGNLDSGLFLGCYSTVPDEVQIWKRALPSLRVIGGYFGSGPASDREEARQVITDLLAQEGTLIRQSDQKKLKHLVESIPSINKTTIGLYMNECSGKEYYYAKDFRNPSAPAQGLSSEFAAYASYGDNYECKLPFKTDQQLLTTYHKILNGDEPLPDDTSKGPLRELYAALRQSRNCPEFEGLTADKVGLLLFFNDFKKNFALVHHNYIERARQELLKNSDMIKRDPTLSQLLARSWLPDVDTIATKDRKQILQNLHDLTQITALAP